MKNIRLYTAALVAAAMWLTSCSHSDDGPTDLEVGRTEMLFPSTGASQTLIVRSITQPAARTDAAWLKAGTVAPSGNGNIMWGVPLTAAPNSGVARTATLTISAGENSVDVKVTQPAATD
ncbi:MAG: BACON domain-containing protein [Muribaculum sp.]